LVPPLHYAGQIYARQQNAEQRRKQGETIHFIEDGCPGMRQVDDEQESISAAS
jgi:hypothetical protein